MKFQATVFVRLRSSVSDAAGNAVKAGCKRLSDLQVNTLRLGKVIDMEIEAPNQHEAEEELKVLSDKFLANTVIEDWSYEIRSIGV